MAFLDDKHLARMMRFDLIYDRMKNLEEFARQNGIDDIFQDNGAKIFQQISILDFEVLEGREGNDAVDRNGQEWELKSINLDNRSSSGITTNHHLTPAIIDKYRHANWAFALYHGIHLESIYVCHGYDLEPYFQDWLMKLNTRDTLNNPKIALKWVKENAYQVYPINYDDPIDPADDTTWHHSDID